MNSCVGIPHPGKGKIPCCQNFIKPQLKTCKANYKPAKIAKLW